MLSVTNQPEITSENIQWGEKLTMITGEKDSKYSQLQSIYQNQIKGASRYEIKGAAHAVHLEKPDDLRQILLKILR